MADVRETASRPAIRERMWVPLWWWPFAAVIIAVLDAEVVPGLPGSWQIASVVIITAIVVSWLISVGLAVVAVEDEGLRAGAARLPYTAMGAVRVVEPATRRALLGPAADPNAYLMTRDWVHGAVYVEVVDEDDPTPYWLVTTRNPQRLAAALRRPDDDGPLSF